jgi:predicted RNA-binding protein with PUA-like domain
MIDVQLVRKFPRLVSLEELRAHEARKLSGMLILRRGNRLSITPVEEKHWRIIESLAAAS